MRRSRRIGLGELPRFALLAAIQLAHLFSGRYGRAEGAHVLLRDADGRILAVRATYMGNRWMLPGGRVERRETPDQAAAREVLEETGLRVSVGRLRLVDARRSHGVSFIFDGEVSGGSLTPQFGEIAEVAWLSPQEIEDIAPRLHRLIEAVDAAGERTAYLGSG